MAFVTNICRLHLTRSQLQAAADAGSLAAVGKLRVRDNLLEVDSYGLESTSVDLARLAAQRTVAANSAAHKRPISGSCLAIDSNLENIESGDIVFGRVDSFGRGFSPTLYSPNSAIVRVGF